MKAPTHKTAKASHYDDQAEHYDAFNDENSKVINRALRNILKKHKVRRVVDFTCGTGSQVFSLTKHGFDVVGVDINSKMLAIANTKAKKLGIRFELGDMRQAKIGQFDAVITIFNAIGHLTKKDFEKTIRNVAENLKPGGIYIFDINNLSYLLKDDNITKLTIDWLKTEGKAKIREVQYSTINEDGVLASYTTTIEQRGRAKPIVSTTAQTLQVYTARQLKELLQHNGFEVLKQCNVDGTQFREQKSDRILTVAAKWHSAD